MLVPGAAQMFTAGDPQDQGTPRAGARKSRQLFEGRAVCDINAAGGAGIPSRDGSIPPALPRRGQGCPWRDSTTYRLRAALAEQPAG